MCDCICNEGHNYTCIHVTFQIWGYVTQLLVYLRITLKLIVRLCIGTTELCNCTYLQVYKPGHLFLTNGLTQHLNQLGIYSGPGIYFQVLMCEIKPGVELQVPLPILKNLVWREAITFLKLCGFHSWNISRAMDNSEQNECTILITKALLGTCNYMPMEITGICS